MHVLLQVSWFYVLEVKVKELKVQWRFFFIACWYKQPGIQVDMQVKTHHDVALVNVPDFRSGMRACFSSSFFFNKTAVNH